MRGTVVASVCVLLAGCASPSAVTGPRAGLGLTLEQVKAGLPELSLQTAPSPGPEAKEYFRHYGLMPPDAAHFYGTFRSGEHRLMAHVYEPPAIRGSVILVHGYYDHAGVWRHLLPHLLSRRYAVAILELPGHGLSTGDRASIRDFAEYRAAVGDFTAFCRERLPGPLHIVAHSMGAGVTADCLLSADAIPHDGKIVFLAPLIRPAHASVSTFGQALVRPFCSSMPRWFRRNSSDEPFLQSVRDDPLQEQRLPLQFCRAMRKWYKAMADRSPSEKEVLIVQGAADTTVDWHYNLRLMRGKFPRAKTSIIPHARHQLANESEALRNTVFGMIDRYLQ